MNKTRIEMDKAKLLKAVRSTIRLKHSLAADEELNRVLPAIEADFDKTIKLGGTFTLETLALLEADDAASN